jgi:membrane associated rhomboid family serine protease
MLSRLNEKWAQQDFLSHILLLAFLGMLICHFNSIGLYPMVRLRNVLGGNFSLVGVPSLGASGAIFGTAAVRSSLYSIITLNGSPGCMGRSCGSLEVSISARQESTSVNQ